MRRHGHLLCVDDNPLSTFLMQEYSRLRGLPEVQVTGSVAEAVAMARADPPLAVLLDLNLHDGSGLEVLIQLRADAATRDVPVVIVSGSVDEAEREAAMALGAQAWWPKPLDLSVLDRQLELLIAH